MASVTDHYGITRPVPFVNVQLEVDNQLFVDPHAVRLSAGPAPFADEAVVCLDSFLNSITSAVMSNDSRERTRALKLVQCFHEPWQTRMGLSRKGIFGHGGASVAGSSIWTALSTDLRAFVDVGLLHRLEHLPIFVEGIDRDITSDIATRIIFGPLARFTSAMVAEYEEFSTGQLSEVEMQVWDPSKACWQSERTVLPVIDGKPLVLVPHAWARPNLLMSSRRFFETSLLSYVQVEQSAILASGKLLTTPKWALKEQEGLARGRTTNMTVTLRASKRGDDLIRFFEAFVAERYHAGDADAA